MRRRTPVPSDAGTLGRLGGGLAHDLNNLLTAITGRVDLLMAELEEEDLRREALSDLKHDAAEVARVVRKLVAYSGQAPIRPRTVRVAALLEGFDHDVVRRRGGEVRVVMRIESARARVRVDPDQMEQVVDALVDNALEAMPSGGVLLLQARVVDATAAPRLKAADPFRWPGEGRDYGLRSGVRAAEGRGRAGTGGGRSGDPPAGVVRIEVADNGSGMDSETRSRAFEPYFSTKTGRAGRGLELAAAREIVHQHGGAMTLESRPGRGTAARIYLPAAEPAPRRGASRTAH